MGHFCSLGGYVRNENFNYFGLQEVANSSIYSFCFYRIKFTLHSLMENLHTTSALNKVKVIR